jgi:hypothetical protein
MNFFKDLISAVPYSSVFGIVSTILLLLVFAGVVVWVMKLDNRYVENMRQLPLEMITGNANEEHHG